jgi:hypothetical protein
MRRRNIICCHYGSGASREEEADRGEKESRMSQTLISFDLNISSRDRNGAEFVNYVLEV